LGFPWDGSIFDSNGPEAMIDQPLYDLPGAAMKLGNVSRSTIYRLIEQGKLVRVNLGTKALITGASLGGLIEEMIATPVSAHNQKRDSQKR
jgi:excisionase family DNA binding protein